MEIESSNIIDFVREERSGIAYIEYTLDNGELSDCQIEVSDYEIGKLEYCQELNENEQRIFDEYLDDIECEIKQIKKEHSEYVACEYERYGINKNQFI